jgi:predicted RNA binding protein YcfA (HicA-like mRNA interferase family)
METNTAKILRRLKKEGWYVEREGKEHAIYRHPTIEGVLSVPRHTELSPGVARSLAKKAGWAH